jgi:hypothetical protein
VNRVCPTRICKWFHSATCFSVRLEDAMSQAASSRSITHPSRLRPVMGLPAQTALWEFAILLISGALAAIAVGLIELRLRIPGHSILHAVLPMALGLALVPRRWAGCGMSVAACVTAFGISRAGHGEFGAGSWTSLVTLGPAMDLLLASRWGRKWPAFSLALAGLVANLAAFTAKAAEKLIASGVPARIPGSGMGGGRGMGNGMGGGRGLGRAVGGGGGLGRTLDEWISVAPLSYLLCGLIAGLICGVAFFHFRQKTESTNV